MRNLTGASILAIDVKGEYQWLLGDFYGLHTRVVDPVVTPLNPCNGIDMLLSSIASVFDSREARYFAEAVRIACEAREPLPHIVSDYVSSSELSALASCFNSESPLSINDLRHGVNILYLGSLSRLCPSCLPVMYLYIVESMLASRSDSVTVLIVDEAWNLARHVSPRDLASYLRLARGAGVAFFMATQSLDDIKDFGVVLENSSLALIFAADPVAVARLSHYLKIPRSVLEEASKLYGVGECIAKLPGAGGFRLCYVDPSPSHE